jgi:hypothetical protein
MGSSVYKYALVIRALSQPMFTDNMHVDACVPSIPRDVRALVLSYLFELATAPLLYNMYFCENLNIGMCFFIFF